MLKPEQQPSIACGRSERVFIAFPCQLWPDGYLQETSCFVARLAPNIQLLQSWVWILVLLKWDFGQATYPLLSFSFLICEMEIIIFSSVRSLSHVRLFVAPWTAPCPASLSITNSRNPPKPMSIESMMSSNRLILCRPLILLPSIFPSTRVFSNESALCIRWPKYWSFSFNISPSNEHPGLISFRIDWLDIGLAKMFIWVFLLHLMEQIITSYRTSCTNLLAHKIVVSLI